jgi:tetratricopeptide (TPR) repeat protein
MSNFRPLINCRAAIRVCAMGSLVIGMLGYGSNARAADDKSEEFKEPAGEPPTDEQCAKFGQAIEKALREGDTGEFNRLIDIETFFRRGESGLSLPADVTRVFRTAIQQTMAGRAGIVGNAAHQVANGAELKYTKVRKKAGKKSVMIRLAGETGLVFYEFTLTRGPDGDVVATDCYDYAAGERLSEGLRRGLLITQGALKEKPSDGIPGPERDVLDHAEDLTRLMAARGKGDNAKALEIIESLPESLRKRKFMFIHWVACAQAVDEVKYLRVLEEFRKLFPDDPSVDFLSIDAHFLRGNFKDAVACVDRLHKSLGGDPYVTTLKANIQLQQADYKGTRKSAEDAIKEGDARPDPYFALIVASLRERKHEETLGLLKRIAQKCDVWLVDIEGNPEYADFIESPQHEAWQEHAATRSRK